jgi:4-amino-4-deoxy-L-arabinose transferase-like glycosyltransferase
MEAAGALGRARPHTYLEAFREAVRSRSRAFWIVAGLTVLAAALRFATLGVQSYHHDEIVTASRILRDGFWHAMDAVGFSESAPPLYYALAWAWTRLTGTGEVGLRSFSALAGVATVPVAYLLGTELRGRRTGIVAAALVAVNPMLLWYSQEARAYALFALLTAVSLLYFVRALDRGRRRDFVAWGIASALALATHYFAAFPVLAEALWLLHRRRRQSAPGLAIVAGAGLLLAPLAIHQMSIGHAEWIGNFTLGHRLGEAGLTFALGETGDIIARPTHPLLALAPFLLSAAGLALALVRGERRAAGIPLALAAVTICVPLGLALLDPGKDYVLTRNLIPAAVPLLVAIATGFTLQRARRAGAVLAAALVVYSLGFSIWASVSPALQRPDWDAVAAAIGEPQRPRAMVTWTLGEASLRYYLSTGSVQVGADEGFEWGVGEIDFISDGPAPPPPRRILGPGFREAGYRRVGRLYVRRYAVPGPGLEPLRLRTLPRAGLGFRSNGVLLDGVSPP